MGLPALITFLQRQSKLSTEADEIRCSSASVDWFGWICHIVFILYIYLYYYVAFLRNVYLILLLPLLILGRQK